MEWGGGGGGEDRVLKFIRRIVLLLLYDPFTGEKLSSFLHDPSQIAKN